MKRGKKSGLVYFTYNDIKSWDPCYDPIKRIPANWKGTAVDILKLENVSFSDALWCVLRTEICSEKLMRLFAVYCYRDTLNWVKNPDPRSAEAANVAERFALGNATKKELAAAESTARYAALSAALSAESAARYAAWSAAESAAESAAWSAARYAAWSAARYAAWSAAESAAQERYKAKLIEMLIAEGKEYVGNRGER